MHAGVGVGALYLGQPGEARGSGTRVITIQSAMLVALGVLSAGFIVLLVMPFYRRRAERLAIAEVKRHLPMTEAEIRADKDRLRAEYAIRIHQLESRVEDASQQAARQRIELNRRDGAISGLESEIGTLRTTLEEYENARRVLEQTITDRLPKVEQRLAQARELLHQRDKEIERLTRSADQTSRALEEARQINTHQRDELLRTSATLASRAARNRDQLSDPRFDAEVALRSEMEALRARTREQAEMITRLQGLLVRGGKSAEAKTSGDEANAPDGERTKDREIAHLRARLAETESSLKAAKSTAEVGKAGQQQVYDELRSLKTSNDNLSAEVARLKASLSIYESAQKDETAIRDSKVAMKARMSALEAEVTTNNKTIQALRAEIAAGNERLARQAAHYRDELRRLGAGTLPTTAEPRTTQEEQSSRRRPSLAERMGAPRPVALKPVDAADKERTDSYLKALSGRGPGEKAPAESVVSLSELASAAEKNGGSQDAAVSDSETKLSQRAPAAPEDASAAKEAAPRRRASLLDRISSVSKSSS